MTRCWSSIGYDLTGIRSNKVVEFIRGMIDARESIERLRNEIPRRLAPLRELDYPTELSRSITLSTFHGCPAGEIERRALRIARRDAPQELIEAADLVSEVNKIKHPLDEGYRGQKGIEW
jgi:hypothetical protein